MARKRKAVAGVWEPGYRSHHYWSSGESKAAKKLGSIRLERIELAASWPSSEMHAVTVYRWTCGTFAGEAPDLKGAKRAVEMAHFTGTVQLNLFDLEGNVVERVENEPSQAQTQALAAVPMGCDAPEDLGVLANWQRSAGGSALGSAPAH